MKNILRWVVLASMCSPLIAQNGGSISAGNDPLGAAAAALTFANLQSGLYGSQAMPQFANMIADYQLQPTDCASGVPVAPVDYSGHGNTGTLGTGINAPTCNAQGLVLNGAAGTAPNSGQYFYSAGTQNMKTIMLVYSDPVPPFTPFSGPVSPKFPGLFGNPLHAGFQFVSPNYGFIPEVLANGGISGRYQTNFEGTHVLIMTFGAGAVNDVLTIDGVDQPNIGNGHSFGLSNGVFLVGGGGIDFNAETYFTGQVYRATFWSTALVSSEKLQASNLARKAAVDKGVSFDIPTNQSITNILMCDGNSLVAGPNVTPACNNYLTTRLTYTQVNYGIGSLVGEVMNSMYPYRVGVLDAPMAGSRVHWIWELTNSKSLGGDTDRQAADPLFAMCDKDRARGIRSIISTMLDRNVPANESALKNSVNAVVRTEWAQHCDALADIAASANVGADGAAANGAVFTDGIHVQQTVQQNTIGPIVSHAIDQVTGSTPQNCDPTVVTASTYATTASDGCKRFNTASNSITDTLQSAVGYTGRVIRRCNSSLSGTNTLTVAAPSDLPFNNISGSTTVAVPNNTCKDFQGMIVSPSTGNAYWQQLN